MKASSLLPPSSASPLSLPHIPEDSPLPLPSPPRSPPRRHSRTTSSGSHSPLLKSLWRPSHGRTLPLEYGGVAPDISVTGHGDAHQPEPLPPAGDNTQTQGPLRSERPRRSLSSPFPLSSTPLVPPRSAAHLPLYHSSSSGSKERFDFPLDKDRPYHPSSPARRREQLNAELVMGRLTRVLGICALLAVVAFVTCIGSDVLAGLEGEELVGEEGIW